MSWSMFMDTKQPAFKALKKALSKATTKEQYRAALIASNLFDADDVEMIIDNCYEGK